VQKTANASEDLNACRSRRNIYYNLKFIMAALACTKNINDKFSNESHDQQQYNRQQLIINQLQNDLSFIFFALILYTLHAS